MDPATDTRPDGSRVQVVEATSDRMVWYIPASGRGSRGLGCFVALWFAVLIAITGGLVQFGIPQFGLGGLIPAGLLTVFWIVGIVIGFIWIKFRFERLFVLIDHERAVLQRVLFGRKRLEELPLDATARCFLVESYTQNDVPVYKVAIESSAGQISFGTSFAPAEKDWCVDRINEFVRGNSEVTGDGATSPGKTPADAATIDDGDLGSFPSDRIRIVNDEPDHLRLELQGVEHDGLRCIMFLGGTAFALFWYGLLGIFAVAAIQAPLGGVQWAILLFLLPFGVAGLMPVGLSSFAMRGQVTIDLDRERISCRYHAGQFGKTWSLPTETITTVGTEAFAAATRNPRARTTPVKFGQQSDHLTCMVHAGDRSIVLTAFNQPFVSRHVAALIRNKLRDLGHTV